MPTCLGYLQQRRPHPTLKVPQAPNGYLLRADHRPTCAQRLLKCPSLLVSTTMASRQPVWQCVWSASLAAVRGPVQACWLTVAE